MKSVIDYCRHYTTKSEQVPRDEVLDKSSIVIGGIKARGVVNAIRIARESFENDERTSLSPDYRAKNVAMKVVEVMQMVTS